VTSFRILAPDAPASTLICANTDEGILYCDECDGDRKMVTNLSRRRMVAGIAGVLVAGVVFAGRLRQPTPRQTAVLSG
jgi:hypothetical protein